MALLYPPEGNSTSCYDLKFYCDMFTIRTSICLSKYKNNSCALTNVINIFILKLPKFDRTQPFTPPECHSASCDGHEFDCDELTFEYLSACAIIKLFHVL